MKKIKDLLTSFGICLIYVEIDKKGYYIPEKKIILINRNIDEDEQLRVIFHEIGHRVLHNEAYDLYKKARLHGKMEREANNYMIRNYLIQYLVSTGTDPSDFNYLKFIERCGLDYSYLPIIKETIREYIFKPGIAL